ncbi:WD40 repeat-like protein [Marasmius fiardii PR-910]|nr:WD40 repeat-like protein [Marasmius fiardii PR-910]
MSSIYSYPINRNISSSWSRSQHHKSVLSGIFRNAVLDRVNVLGDNREYGHAGCVNALHWARDGELLLSAGDDKTVQIWRMDPIAAQECSVICEDYPFVCQTIIQTGHRANIFNAHMLPYSSRIVTVAGDDQVRVFDVGHDPGSSTSYGKDGKEYRTEHAQTHTFRCHTNRVKRIVTENSPDLFLTVAEDGTVRQHDLRTSHSCRSGLCPPPILSVDHELSTLALSPLTPYQIVVAGSSPYGYLFDRRYTGRILQEEWGMRPNGVTTCVRRFGRPGNIVRQFAYREHITGARMAAENGHEVLLAYSGDAVYLYSALDDPESPKPSLSMLRSNSKRRKISLPLVEHFQNDDDSKSSDGESIEMEDDDDGEEASDKPASENEEEHESENEEDEDEEGSIWDDDDAFHPWVPLIMPRKRYVGARNTDTVKDVNFFGPQDDYVTSGSDDGNFFIWDKSSGNLHGIYEGDGTVVNVIETHPHLPLVAVSGIDHTVKIFAPARGESRFSRIHDAENIIKNNQQRGTRAFRHIRRADLVQLLMSIQAGTRGEDSDDENPADECITQCTNFGPYLKAAT